MCSFISLHCFLTLSYAIWFRTIYILICTLTTQHVTYNKQIDHVPCLSQIYVYWLYRSQRVPKIIRKKRVEVYNLNIFSSSTLVLLNEVRRINLVVTNTTFQMCFCYFHLHLLFLLLYCITLIQMMKNCFFCIDCCSLLLLSVVVVE